MDSINFMDLDKNEVCPFLNDEDNNPFFTKGKEEIEYENEDNRSTGSTEIMNEIERSFLPKNKDKEENTILIHKSREKCDDVDNISKQFTSKIVTKSINFIATHPVDKRKDYIIKKFKVKCGKYFISKLNKLCKKLNKLSTKFHFYYPNSKRFTSVPNYDKNKKWLNYTIEEILTKYDKENGGSNSKTLQKLSQKDERNPTIQEIKRILSLKYEEIIREYSNSEQFDKDVKSFNDEDDRNSFFELGQGYPANFISIMKNIKGNVKKNYNINSYLLH